jgi:23S rRNA (cytosine1962-C5)-methyltransferase
MMPQIPTLAPTGWQDYELIDSGSFEKLERFGPYVLRRPEPQALWPKSLSEAQWEQQSHAYFKKEKGNADKGQWILNAHVPDRWFINYVLGKEVLKFKISLSSFKHVGLFPEQAANWQYIAKHCLPSHQVLNLFAYSGGASLAARSIGAQVSHVDSVKQVVSWARDNMEASNLDNIRWVVDDAMKYVQREIRRGRQYQGIILDPPAYGRGPDGEKWVLEEQLSEILALCSQLLDPNQHFLILNVYSLGLSAIIVQNLIKAHFPEAKAEIGEIFIPDSFGNNLPLGVYCRFFK